MKQYINYGYFAGLILWLIGRAIGNEILLWIATGIMAIMCILVLKNWKENEEIQNIISGIFLIVVVLWIIFKLI